MVELALLFLVILTLLVYVKRDEPYIIRVRPRNVERLLDSAWLVQTLKRE